MTKNNTFIKSKLSMYSNLELLIIIEFPFEKKLLL